MSIILILYFVLLAMVLVYVGVNVYHLVRFRLDIMGDKSQVALSIYLICVVVVVVGSAAMAIFALRV